MCWQIELREGEKRAPSLFKIILIGIIYKELSGPDLFIQEARDYLEEDPPDTDSSQDAVYFYLHFWKKFCF